MLENSGTYAESFNFKFLDDTGATMDDNEWGWWAEYDGENWAPGFWCLNQSGTPVEGDEDVTIKAGEGLWFTSAYAQVPEGESELEVFGFQPAGQVSANDISFKLRDGGNLLGNPMPVGIKLSDITISGYEKDPTMLENSGTYAESFNFKLLDDTGATKDDCEWGWWAEFDGENWAPGFWCLNQSGTPVEGDEDITLKPGQAVWFTSAYAQIPEGEEELEVFTIDFPTPLNND